MKLRLDFLSLFVFGGSASIRRKAFTLCVKEMLISNDSKAEFRCTFSNWLITCQASGRLCLSQQTFIALIQNNYAICELSPDLLTEGNEYVLTGRLQSDQLERRISHYRQLSGGRILLSLQEVIRSEPIIKLKSLQKRNNDTSSSSTPTPT